MDRVEDGQGRERGAEGSDPVALIPEFRKRLAQAQFEERGRERQPRKPEETLLGFHPGDESYEQGGEIVPVLFLRQITIQEEQARKDKQRRRGVVDRESTGE